MSALSQPLSLSLSLFWGLVRVILEGNTKNSGIYIRVFPKSWTQNNQLDKSYLQAYLACGIALLITPALYTLPMSKLSHIKKPEGWLQFKKKTHVCIHTHTHIHAHMYAACIHTHTHIHAHMYAYTHIHAHTYSNILKQLLTPWNTLLIKLHIRIERRTYRSYTYEYAWLTWHAYMHKHKNTYVRTHTIVDTLKYLVD